LSKIAGFQQGQSWKRRPDDKTTDKPSCLESWWPVTSLGPRGGWRKILWGCKIL